MRAKPRCFDREPYATSAVVQDGWVEVQTIDLEVTAYVPNMVEIPVPLSTPQCKQWGPKGAARMYGWNCAGCRWYAEAIRGQVVERD